MQVLWPPGTAVNLATCKGSKDTSYLSLPRWTHCACGGLQVVVITGDNKLTAEAICRQIGVFRPDDDLAGRSLTGRAFAELPLTERRAILKVRTCAIESHAVISGMLCTLLWAQVTVAVPFFPGWPTSLRSYSE